MNGTMRGAAIAPPSPRWLAFAAVAVLTVACGTLPRQETPVAVEPQDGPPPSVVDPAALRDATPRVEPVSRYGNPPYYEAEGQRFVVMASSAGYVERGIASWYGSKFHGRRTSSGEPFDMYAMTAAHPTLPLPTYAEVTNLNNGRKVIVKINDRGPFRHNRLIDLSYAAAVKLGIADKGTGLVEVRAIDPATWQSAPAPAAAPVTVAATGSAAASAPLQAPALYLQVGAFSRVENAERLRSRLDGTAHAGLSVIRASADNPPLYRVRIGPLADVDEADRVSRELLAMGYSTHVVVD